MTQHRIVIVADDVTVTHALFGLVKAGIVATEVPPAVPSGKDTERLRAFDATRPPRAEIANVVLAQQQNLTDREFEVLRGMAAGMSNSQIGNRLCVSEDTVKTHARRLFRRLGAKDRANAVLLGHRRGLLGGES